MMRVANSARRTTLIATAISCLFACTPPVRASSEPPFPLRNVEDLPLPGRTTRFDYQSIDPQHRTLYIAHLGDSAIDVVALDDLGALATIGSIADVHGVLAVPTLGRVFASATGTNELVSIAIPTNQVLGRTRTGDFPDGIAYDPDDGLVLVSNKNDGTETIVDARTAKSVATIPVADEVGNVAYDPASRLAYVAARSPETLSVLAVARHRVVDRIALHGCDGAHGVYILSDAARAFVACENNARLVTVDLVARRQTGRTPVGAKPDVLAYDPGLGRLYVAAESGIVSVFRTASRKLELLGQRRLARGAHTVAVDPTTHRVFFPLPRGPSGPTLRVLEPTSQ